MASQARQQLVRLTAFGLFSGFLLSASGCSSTTHEIPLYTQGPVLVSLRSFAQGAAGPALRYDHPVSLSSERVGNFLAAIGIEELSFFKWREKGALLAPEDVAQLAPKLTEALRKASADQWVTFSVRNVPKSFTFGAIRISDGIAFVQGGKLNLVFDNIAYVENVDTQPSRIDPRDAATSVSVRLTAKGPGVLGAAPALVPGDRWLGHERTNWLVFDLVPAAAPAPQPQAVATTPAAPPAGTPPPPVVTAPATAAAPAPAASAAAPASLDPEERLRKLKDLRDKGLISADEYEKKRQEILKGL